MVDGNLKFSELSELHAEVQRLKHQLERRTATVSDNADSFAFSCMDAKYKLLITALDLYIGYGTAHQSPVHDLSLLYVSYICGRSSLLAFSFSLYRVWRIPVSNTSGFALGVSRLARAKARSAARSKRSSSNAGEFLLPVLRLLDFAAMLVCLPDH
jgi:hypothetical protein